jgi:hypothetical protein
VNTLRKQPARGAPFGADFAAQPARDDAHRGRAAAAAGAGPRGNARAVGERVAVDGWQ